MTKLNIPYYIELIYDFKKLLYISKLCDLKIGSFLDESDIMTFHLKKMSLSEGEGTDGNLDYDWEHHNLEMNLTLDEQLSYSVVGIKFLLKRHYTQHLMSYYCPSLKFVVVSWISFLIPADAIPGLLQKRVFIYFLSLRFPFTLSNN